MSEGVEQSSSAQRGERDDSDILLNTLNVTFPPHATEKDILQMLSKHGEVAEVTPIYGKRAVCVVYYDARSGLSLVEELGQENCEFVEQTGSRVVRLPGDVQLSPDVVEGVSDVFGDESGTFAVEFFDVRDAARAREGASAPVEGGSGPLDFPNHKAILVSGLPNSLLTDNFLCAMLHQAGFKDSVRDCKCREGEPTGEVLLRVSTWAVVEQCINHFDGCQWDKSGILVSAQVIDLDEASDALPIMRPPEEQEDIHYPQNGQHHQHQKKHPETSVVPGPNRRKHSGKTTRGTAPFERMVVPNYMS
mmetsp:Transcript_13185/g.30029  ORF Transcript_13185/g.30029 Transcript_13185/m.30029 type:complete len:305 (-) Transcript_13185:37-951(-)